MVLVFTFIKLLVFGHGWIWVFRCCRVFFFLVSALLLFRIFVLWQRLIFTIFH